eukprot:10993529-Ditylum_brightwellii.AAC.1
MSPAVVLHALQTPCVIGTISWFGSRRVEPAAMVAMVVGQLCPVGACKGTRQLIVVLLLLFGEKWVLWAVSGEVLAVSLIGHG